MSCAARNLIGEKLVEKGNITQDQLRIALREQSRSGTMIGVALVNLGFIDGETLASLLAEKSGHEKLDIGKETLDASLLKKFPVQVAKSYRALPVSVKGASLRAAMSDPYDLAAIDGIRRYFPNVEIVPLIAAKTEIDSLIDECYGNAASVSAVVDSLESGHQGGGHPIVRLVESLLADAVGKDASDIHIEPEGNSVRVRYRVDGSLRHVTSLHSDHWQALSQRVKIVAGMNIANSRIMQDGRFSRVIDGGNVDFRAAIMPTVWGENIAIRVLDHKKALLPLESLGFENDTLYALKKLAARPQGITLVTGPTGSGKTTTLYSVLREICTPDINVVALEDPVEYRLESVRQTAVQEERGLGFAAGIRGMLRMDPDVMLIGEIRDAETAQMAFRASMTGHRIFTTLHCNDAIGSVARLEDLGVQPGIFAENVNGALSQRLARKLCPHCKSKRSANGEEKELIRVPKGDTATIFEAAGCRHCEGTGTKGRTVISEIAVFSTEADETIANMTGRNVLARRLRDEGFVSMQENGIKRVLDGEISLNELRRCVDMEKGG